ncbi:HAUS6 protein, partial [Thinocorus orbignyianus]|nr:HAUS6 protein [Thinocorus orbignyianus]
KVRDMWTVVIEILTSLEKEKEIVDHALQGHIGQYVLNGSSVAFSIPQLLAQRVENDVHQHWSGNVYEDGKLNFLMVIQLLNEALRTLRDEIHQSELTPHLEYIKTIIVKYTEILQTLQSIRLRLNKRYYASKSESISREQEDWKERWTNFLNQSPLNFILEHNPVSNVQFI